jgi:hypothetical protein
MINPLCDCGEDMWLEDISDEIYRWLPGSPEIRRLFAMSAIGLRRVWTCPGGCGKFFPSVAL